MSFSIVSPRSATDPNPRSFGISQPSMDTLTGKPYRSLKLLLIAFSVSEIGVVLNSLDIGGVSSSRSKILSLSFLFGILAISVMWRFHQIAKSMILRQMAAV